MSNLLVSFDPYQSDWYVGELYKYFIDILKNKHIHIQYINIKKLAEKYNYQYRDNDFSIFNIYNLIITNTDNKKTFIHSLHDGAVHMMDENSGIDNFDVSAFSCCSNLTQNLYNKYSKYYNIYPSFYILENLSDLTYIEKYFKLIPYKDKKYWCYFNGLCYGHRALFKNALKDNEYFNFKDKSEFIHYRSKRDYFDELSQYSFGLSLDGAAKICYRDIEYFGLGIPCLREKLNILTHDPIIENIHYINFIDEEVNKLLYSNSINELNKKLKEKIIKLHKDPYINNIIYNAKEWYNNNATISSQCNILYTFLEKSGIL